VGFDEKRTLGKKETGAMAALPVWIDFMKVALQGHDGEDFLPPPDNPKNPVAKVDTPDHRPGDGEAH
jgi:penicillin-binding protein 1A